jgi:hypothetical protein
MYKLKGKFQPLRYNKDLEHYTNDDVEIISEDIPGWLVSYEGTLTVALDITVTDAPEAVIPKSGQALVERS